ncbi:lactate racemase domain-containing protein [Sodalis sp. RH21]|uniref:lactate racemase domain-containing protein n=1 Tax=unclassified Sodalis (in: enterobacteria) TaxID=2636512 RepID=UPI0039B6181C
MLIIDNILADVILPDVINVSQRFAVEEIDDVEKALRKQLNTPEIKNKIKPGANIAVGVGSRGIADLPLLVSVTVDELKLNGANPFIVPAMGSHGGASAEGQTSVLAALGVTEESAGCPIISSMAVENIGEINGFPVYMDKAAMEADGIVVINRIKPHTSFTGKYESGLLKMIVIGLGKQKGANSAHMMGFGHMAKNLIDFGKYKIENTPILFGVGSVENAYDHIAKIAVIPAEDILEKEAELLQQAKKAMPSIPFNPIDVLIVDSMGKHFSGNGTDPNITGKVGTPYIHPMQKTNRMAILDLHEKSHGNAAGVGLAEFTTRRLFNKIDFEQVYANHLTSTTLPGAKVPIVLDSDLLVIKACIFTSNVEDPEKLRIVRLRNTLTLDHMQVSVTLLDEIKNNPNLQVQGSPAKWEFDEQGNISDLDAW